MHQWRRLTVAFSLLLSGNAFGVEPGAVKVPQKVEDRWSVVGVIAGDSTAAGAVGIAVLRHNVSKRTFTLSIGETLPNDFAFTLKAVKDRTVVVSDGREQVTLSYAEASTEESETVSRTARFIDNYYKSFEGKTFGGRFRRDPYEAGGEGEGGEAYDPGVRAEAETGYVPLTQDDVPPASGRSRFELYREERRQAADVYEQGGQSGEGGLYEGAEGNTASYEEFATDPYSQGEGEALRDIPRDDGELQGVIEDITE